MGENDKSYTLEQLFDAEDIAQLLKSVSKENRKMLVILTQVFISGVKAGERLDKIEVV